jgi:hypothetical protein
MPKAGPWSKPLRQDEDEQEDESQEDEIKREDGLVRYWMFFNGEEVQLFSALAAAFFGVLWCFLYVLGAGQSVFGIVLGVFAIGCFCICWVLSEQLQKCAETGWRKDKRSPKRDKIEIRVAIILWLFIFVSVGAILLRQWWHSR